MNEAVKAHEKGARKFKPLTAYSHGEQYQLLPFRFSRLDRDREVLVNELGDHLVVPAGTTARLVRRELSKEEDFELYGDLCANFFLCEEEVPAALELLAARYRTKKSFLEGFTALHIFVISLRCDHTCHYCQVSRVSKDRHTYDMSEETIDRGIALMMQSPNPHVTMEFQGGEALLAFDRIVYAIEKTKQEALRYKKKMTYVICTNLAMLTDEMLEYCRDNHVLVSTSLDGPDYIHNSNRPRPGKNSHQLAIEGIERCRVMLGNDRVSALLTTTQLTLQHPVEVVQEYVRLGFANIFLRPISPYGFAVRNERKNKYDTETFLAFYKTALDLIISYNKQGTFIREDYATIILKKILTPFPVGYVDLQSPAGMINKVIVFNYNGQVYASDEARMLAEMKDETFLLGNLHKNSYEELFYGDKAQSFSKAWTNESLAGCSQCAFQTYCGADPVYHHATQGDMYGYRPTSGFCARNMYIIRHLIDLMDRDAEVEQIFWTWVTDKA
jgi:His-Xaa-Ser system radical SAM maturase HxsB